MNENLAKWYIEIWCRDISKISILLPAIRYDTIYRYRIDISIFSIYRYSTNVDSASFQAMKIGPRTMHFRSPIYVVFFSQNLVFFCSSNVLMSLLLNSYRFLRSCRKLGLIVVSFMSTSLKRNDSAAETINKLLDNRFHYSLKKFSFTAIEYCQYWELKL